jgi:hypothetical protein
VRLLDVELRRPQIARAKELCDEIESLLVDLSTVETCASSEGLEQIEQFLEREQILLRINLIRAEL